MSPDAATGKRSMERVRARVLCKRCEKFFTPGQGKRLRGTDRLGICLACLEAWRETGSTCTICQRQVRADQEIGYFPEQKGIGHYDCGAIRIEG